MAVFRFSLLILSAVAAWGQPMYGDGMQAVSADSANPTDPANPADPLPVLVREALLNNPGLKAARLDPDIARQQSRGEKALDPPQVGVEFFHAPTSSFPDPLRNQEEIDYFVQQSLPFPGKRGARAEPGRLRARSAEARARAMETEVAAQVRSAYFDLTLAEADRRINADDQALVRRFVESARRQYEQGLGRQADILRAHGELASLADEDIRLGADAATARLRLNALLDRPADAGIPPPPALKPVPVSFSVDRVLAAAEAGHPALAAWDAEIAALEAEASSARKGQWPDLMLRGTYKDMREPPQGAHGGTPSDGWAVMLGVELPIAPWSRTRYQAGYRGAEAALAKARLERRSEAVRVGAGIRVAFARAGAAAERLELARAALVPHSEQALESVLTAYNNGKADFTDSMDAYGMAIDARRREQEALVNVMRGRADLEQAAGMDLERLEGRGEKP